MEATEDGQQHHRLKRLHPFSSYNYRVVLVTTCWRLTAVDNSSFQLPFRIFFHTPLRPLITYVYLFIYSFIYLFIYLFIYIYIDFFSPLFFFLIISFSPFSSLLCFSLSFFFFYSCTIKNIVIAKYDR